MYMNNDMELTLLDVDEISNPNTMIKVLEMYGLNAHATDLAMVTGCLPVSQFSSVIGRSYWLKANGCYLNQKIFDSDRGVTTVYCTERDAIRPVLLPANFKDVVANSYQVDLGFNVNIDVVDYGEYPQIAPRLSVQAELDENYVSNNLKTTGREYTFDAAGSSTRYPFKPVTYPEYEYNGEKYIRVKVNSTAKFRFILSNSVHYNDGEYVWIQVKPVTWLIDYENRKLISCDVLVAGIPFTSEDNYTLGYEGSGIKEYLNKYMLPEMLGKNAIKSEASKLVTKVKKKNAYGLNFDEVSEEDIIKGAIISNVPVFLHGPSSEGKSSRVKQIDPSCEIIYLRNATPESLNGKSVYNAETGEMIDIKPTWLKKLELKCQDEPDKLHILFFDELTNALPSIQGMAFNIVLDREVNGIWQLPENARIVAAGNEMDDSLAANELAEPLYNRFAHVNIKTTTASWLKWASMNNIHPAIYTYIAYKDGDTLRSKYDGKKPNADPRKWEMASKMLYQTGNPEMLRSLVGEEITREFVAFCKTEVITLEDVINDNYTDNDIKNLDTAERYATVLSLSIVDEDNLEKVRNFVAKIGGEYRAIFDLLWTRNDLERLEKIASLNVNDIIIQESQDNDELTKIDYENMEMTLLTKEEVDSLAVLKRFGKVMYLTDLALSSGAFCFNDTSMFKCPGIYYTKTKAADIDGGGIIYVTANGVFRNEVCGKSDFTIRPVLVLPQNIFSRIYENKCDGYNETYEVEFGEYPRSVVDIDMHAELINACDNGLLKELNYEYTFGENTYKQYKVYEYKNNKYIYIECFCWGTDTTLSDFSCYDYGDKIWIKVEPVVWLIDEENQRLISKYGLLAGIPFDTYNKKYEGDFEATNIYQFMNEILLKDILHSYMKEEKVKRKKK